MCSQKAGRQLKTTGSQSVDDLGYQKIDQSIQDRKKLHRTFLDHVKTYKPFLELEEKAFQDGALTKRNHGNRWAGLDILRRYSR
jgi:hypothetical protein